MRHFLFRPLSVLAIGAASVAGAYMATSSAVVTGVPVGAGAFWSGTFDGANDQAWQTAWGITPGSTNPDNRAYGFAEGLAHVVSDPASPQGQVLQVTYPAHSSSLPCGCTLGGTQFYQDIGLLGDQAIQNGPTLDLKYYYRFPVGYDFGSGGKMPGLWAGDPNVDSACFHSTAGWSTRMMFRGGNNGEVYYYSPTATVGCGADLGVGSWHWMADNKWHSIEQLVDRNAQTVTVWSDEVQVFHTSVHGVNTLPFRGIFFSTYYGGHAPSWGPQTTMQSYFAAFSLSTAHQPGPPVATSPSATPPPTPTPSCGATPPAPMGVQGTANGGGQVTVSWSAMPNGCPWAFALYAYSATGTPQETVVTSNSAQLTLTANAYYTFTVTAWDGMAWSAWAQWAPYVLT